MDLTEITVFIQALDALYFYCSISKTICPVAVCWYSRRMTKVSIRQAKLAARASLSADDVSHASEAIKDRFIRSIDWEAVGTVHANSSVRHEVPTDWLAPYLDSHWPHVRLTYGQPLPSAEIPGSPYDLIIVPVVAFDTKLRRIGYGGGWYDRFLSVQPGAIKVGLAYDVQRASHLPVESHDISLDMIVTEQALFTR